MIRLARLLLDAGLIQFGWFRREGEIMPFALRVDMLASYPDALQAAAAEAQAAVGDAPATRLLCTSDSIPFGVAYSLRSAIPLVYSRGSDEAPVFDLIGAYDIGHPTLLLTDSIGWQTPLTPLIAGARRVGLEVHTLLTILETRSTSSDGLTVLPLLRLSDLACELSADGQLAPAHAQAVLDWIEGTET